ncbi:FKBP-type peptidyl-prolyl cis-trans isomerase [Erythrobacteraceae bacterium CFH 75059]|uniref:FKBP-type peptidyl-prolyl cis-trans isomerase n=1 Tax=Qipengyuania thermophila TaxID=2509361 RepID=UPI0010228515|nr:FKBP-type peptidyl-prolyl cis-trans isomerase [Qipengyuania thermophila]TCD06597.1 FKBP-type peptidyl-prolyl cis-trans isomerase [Erythrobacteraceae bacterium CFH 75059]
MSRPGAAQRSACAALLLAAGAVLAASGAATAGQNGAGAPAAKSTAWHNAQRAHLAGLAPADGWQTLEGGLKWRRIAGGGTGERPTPESIVTVHYTGRFIDGEVFDSSVARGEPATFPLARLVRAWQIAIPQMAVGDTIEIAAPAELAYGASGRGPIPGGATLLFSIELLRIE